MKFLANENIPLASILILRDNGYDVTSIGEDNPSISDNQVMQFAITENRTIITFDRDYGELIFKNGYRPRSGVIYLRLFDNTPDEPAFVLIDFFNQNIAFENFFTVINETGIRQRKIN